MYTGNALVHSRDNRVNPKSSDDTSKLSYACSMATPGAFVFVDVNANIRDEKVRKQVRSRAAAHSHMVAPRRFKSRLAKWIDEREKVATRVRKKRGDLGLRNTRPSAESAKSEQRASNPGVPLDSRTDCMALAVRTNKPTLAEPPPTAAAHMALCKMSVGVDQPQLKYPVPFQPIFAKLFQLRK